MYDETYAQAIKDVDAMASGDPERAVQDLRTTAVNLLKYLAELRTKAEAVAEEYERQPRQLSSGAVADMLREWVGVYR